MLERPYWLEVSPRPEALVGCRELPQRTDVVVIGGGYTGLSAALTLAQAGAAVTVIERGTLGSGASTRNAGFVLPGYRRDARALVATLGAVQARDLYDASRTAVQELSERASGEQPELPCDYRPVGHLVLAAKPKHFLELEREGETLSKVLRHETQLLPRDKVVQELGASIAYFGARVDPLAGSLNPAKLYWSLARAAAQAGVTLVEEIEVESVRREADRFQIRTSGGTLGAKDVVVATGGTGSPVLPSLERRIFSRSGTLITTAPLGEHVARTLIPRDRVVTDSRDRLTWFRLARDTRLIFGGEAPARQATRTERIRGLCDAMTAHFPRLLGTDVDYHWSGKVAMTYDGLPHAGEKDGVHFALGCNGYGVALALYLGSRVAARVAGNGDLEPFRSLRFRRIPPWYGAVTATMARIRNGGR